MKIGRRKIGPGHPTFILAEAGTNHLGDVNKAIALVKAAYLAGCDGVKFQMFVKDAPLFCPMEGDDRRRERWNQSAMSWGQWQTVREYAADKNLAFVLSVFQINAIGMANKLELDMVKVASRAVQRFPYDKCHGPFILSNGLGDISGTPVSALVLQCVMEYPAPLNESFWRTRYDGISDHSGTVWPAIDACFKRAGMVEVHFATDKADAGPDAPVCLTPGQIELICEARDAAAEM